MTSIGNDIVDLKHIHIHRTQQPRFYSKILSATEQQLYSQQLYIPFEYFVWLLWSVKESAYKYLQRQQPDLVFSPVKIAVSNIISPKEISLLPFPAVIEKIGLDNLNSFTTKVTFNSRIFYARSVIYCDDLIHTVVCGQDNFEQVFSGIKYTLDPDQSSAVRSFLLEKLSYLFPGKSFKIEKGDNGVPFVKVVDDKTTIPVSLSHHGKYLSYAFPIPNVS